MVESREKLTAPDDFGIGGEKWRDLRQGGEDWRPTRLSSVSVSTIKRETGHSDVQLHSGADWWVWWREWWTLVTSFQDLIKYGGRGGGATYFQRRLLFPKVISWHAVRSWQELMKRSLAEFLAPGLEGKGNETSQQDFSNISHLSKG